MDEKLKTNFPVILYRHEEKAVDKFKLVFRPEDLPVGEAFMIFSTSASEEALRAVQRAFSMGYSDGVKDQ